jgi:hypothetical protein
MSIVGLVAAITIRSINDGDKNVVSIKLELLGVILLPRGHFRSNTPSICSRKDVFDFDSRNLFQNVSYKIVHTTVKTALSRSWM